MSFMKAYHQNQDTFGTGAMFSPLVLYTKPALTVCSLVNVPSKMRGLAW